MSRSANKGPHIKKPMSHSSKQMAIIYFAIMAMGMGQTVVFAVIPMLGRKLGLDLIVLEIPVLGICLGHQSIGQVYGGDIIRAGQVMHGKTSDVYHAGQGVFSGLPNPYKATRYHSLVIDKQNLPDCLEITAWTQNPDGSMEEIMGVRHKELAVEGVQFHPESILTEHGHELLDNFLKTTLNRD